MKKIKSKSQLEDLMSEQLAWRRKELHDFKSIIRSKKDSLEVKSLLRGGLVLAYSHWEGFIKEASIAYLSYISFRGFKSSDIADNFFTLFIHNAIKRGKSFSECILFIKNLRENPDNICSIPTKDIINTESNLNSEVLRNIMEILGLDYRTHFELKKQFIDKEILGNRNQIAHGEVKHVELDDFISVANYVIESMDLYKTLIQNSVDLEAYLKRVII